MATKTKIGIANNKLRKAIQQIDEEGFKDYFRLHQRVLSLSELEDMRNELINNSETTIEQLEDINKQIETLLEDVGDGWIVPEEMEDDTEA